MNLLRRLTVKLLMAVALTASAQVFFVTRLVPKNVSTDRRFLFTISSSIDRDASFSITVAPTKEAAYPLSTDARVMMFDGTNVISVMSLNDQGQEEGKAYHYTFKIATNYLAYSQFVFRYSDWTNRIGSDDTANSYYFFLGDFVHAAASVPDASSGHDVLALGMAQADVLTRLHDAGAVEVAKDVLPSAKGWALAATQDSLFLRYTNGVLSGISVESNSDKPKIFRHFYETNSYSLR